MLTVFRCSVILPVYLRYMVYYYILLFLVCLCGLIFLVGSSIGSFLDVVRMRASWKESTRGRSKCRDCKKDLCWYELLPVVSYVVLWGRCSYCKKSIPVYHLIAEILMGSLFVLAFLYWLSGGLLLVALVSAVSAIFLVPIVVQDIEQMEVPEHISFVFACVAFTLGFLIGGFSALLSGLLLALPFFLLWFCSRGKMMGLGDAKVAVSLGFLLSAILSPIPIYIFTFSVFIFTFWIGLIGLVLYVLYRLIAKGSFSMRRDMHMPLIPSMVAAYFLVLLTEISFLDVTVFLQYLFV